MLLIAGFIGVYLTKKYKRMEQKQTEVMFACAFLSVGLQVAGAPILAFIAILVGITQAVLPPVNNKKEEK